MSWRSAWRPKEKQAFRADARLPGGVAGHSFFATRVARVARAAKMSKKTLFEAGRKVANARWAKKRHKEGSCA